MRKALQDWEMLPLGSVATLQRGYDLPVQGRRPGPYPVFAANGPVGFHDAPMTSGPGVVTGRSGSIGRVHFVNGPFWPLNTALWVRDFHGNDPEWVKFLLEWFDLGRFSRGAAVPTLDRKLVHGELVPVPPVYEQRRIVVRIKECLERVEEIESLRAQATREARNIEFACFHDALIDGVQQKGWPVRTLGDVAKSFRYGTSAKAHTQAVGLPVLRMGNLQGGYLDFSDLKYIELPEAEADRYKLNVGEILINRTNSLELVGKAAMFTAAEGNWVFASYLVRVEVDSALALPEFVTAVINSRMGRDYVLRTARRAIGMVNLNAKEMAKFPMPLPSLDGQEKVVDQLKAARPLAEELRASMVEPEIGFLRKSILQKAFAGEL